MRPPATNITQIMSVVLGSGAVIWQLLLYYQFTMLNVLCDGECHLTAKINQAWRAGSASRAFRILTRLATDIIKVVLCWRSLLCSNLNA